MKLENAFTMDTSSIKYGPGVTREIGYDMEEQGCRRVMVVTDRNLSKSDPVAVTLEALRGRGIDTVLFDQSSVEPTDVSFKEAIAFAVQGKFDGYVAVGGGSSMDTCKAANLYATHPADFMTYVNPPIGKGTPVPGPLKPMMAIPTTAGTGSETTGVTIFDYLEMGAKTGIASRALRPIRGLIDPDNTRSLPRMVAACTGLDQLTHALEAITALPFNQRPAPEQPRLRPAYQGANPISHVWASRAVEMIATDLVRVFDNPADDSARGQVLLAATYAGIGFGNSGVHLAHGMSYPVSGMVRNYVIRPDIRSSPTAWRSASTHRPCFASRRRPTRPCICMLRNSWATTFPRPDRKRPGRSSPAPSSISCARWGCPMAWRPSASARRTSTRWSRAHCPSTG
jgi:hydroxyacid-oxoacid transhydrogenase